jgi:hypothetical protein
MFMNFSSGLATFDEYDASHKLNDCVLQLGDRRACDCKSFALLPREF